MNGGEFLKNNGPIIKNSRSIIFFLNSPYSLNSANCDNPNNQALDEEESDDET